MTAGWLCPKCGSGVSPSVLKILIYAGYFVIGWLLAVLWWLCT